MFESETASYYECMQRWKKSYESYARSVGLSYSAMEVLQLIARVENCTQVLLCEKTFLPKQTVNSIVSSFYKRGLLTLQESFQDRRVKTIHLTKAGKEYAEPIISHLTACETQAMGVLNEAERKELILLLKRYVEGHEQHI